MTPAARVQSAIEILDLVITSAREQGPAADRLIADWFRTRRFAGSKDRRAIRDYAWRAIRLCGEIPQTGRSAMLLLAQQDDDIRSLFDGSNYGPAALGENEPVAEMGVAPAWLERELAKSGVAGDDAKALLERAPLDIRINTLKTTRENFLTECPVEAEVIAAPNALRLPHGTPVEQWDTWKRGDFEIQDGGSQIACVALDAKPDEKIVDFCAGGGGKTLSLAALMQNRGPLLACDVDRMRLRPLDERALRAGATNIETRLMNGNREAESLEDWLGKADGVLVDAPCSGIGTWRRNPEARWRLTPAQLGRYVALQSRILDLAASLVSSGGRLVFVTCSLLDVEGADQAASFLQRHPGWKADTLTLPVGQPRGVGVRLSPSHDQTDGFFIARFVRA